MLSQVAILVFGLLFLSVGVGAQSIPVDQVPKLLMFTESVDYVEALAIGPIAPDRVQIGNKHIQVGQREEQFVRALGTKFSIVEEEATRDREAQWAYIRSLAARYNNSMHYYIFAPIYYGSQLSGDFKVLEWKLWDLTMRAYMVRSTEDVSFVVWFLHVIPEQIHKEAVSYVESESMVLVRDGACGVLWDIKTNRVEVSSLNETG